jgi:hypothetical protein
MRSRTRLSVVAFALMLAPFAAVHTTACKKPAADAAADAAVEAAPPASSGVPDAAPSETASEAPSLSAAPKPKAPTNPFASGDNWSGTYQCGAKSSTATLKVTKVAGNSVSAIFDFKTGTGKSGSFQMAGQYVPAQKQLSLSPGAWVVQPAGVSQISLDGNVSADNRTYSGKATGPNCTTFSLRH